MSTVPFSWRLWTACTLTSSMLLFETLTDYNRTLLRGEPSLSFPQLFGLKRLFVVGSNMRLDRCPG